MKTLGLQRERERAALDPCNRIVFSVYNERARQMCGDKACLCDMGGSSVRRRRDKSLFDGTAVRMSLFVRVC